MQLRQLGNSSLMVSPIGVGFWGIVGGDYWGEQDESDTINTVHAALDAGINFIDTAEGYGNGYSEEMLGRALKGRRSEAIIATKVSQSNLAPADLRAACERSLKRLDTDFIDLYQVHWPRWDLPFGDTMSALLELQNAGKIRVIGVSNFGKLDMPDMLNCGRYEANQLPYSLLWRAVEYDIQPQCVEHNIDILPYSPLNQACSPAATAAPTRCPTRARGRGIFAVTAVIPAMARPASKTRPSPPWKRFGKSAPISIRRWCMWRWLGCCINRR